MTSITAQQTKLDLKLVPKENRLSIGKCNERIPRGLKPKEETFQVVLDALALTPCYPVFVITADVPEGIYYQNNVDYMELLWEDFVYQIDKYKTLSWRNKIKMHTSKEDYLINTFRFVSRKEASQKYGAVLPKCLTSPQMKESKAYKTYLGNATGTVPPKVARKLKKASPSKKDSVPVRVDKEAVQKGKRVKRSAKKSSTTPTTCIVIREPPMETQSTSKENVDVARSKEINLLSEVALTEEAQMKEVRKKSLRDFHKSHPSGSGLVVEKPPSVEKITPPVTNEGTCDKPGVPDMTKYESNESESESWGNDKDDNNNEEGSAQKNDSEERESDSEQGIDGSKSNSDFDKRDDDDDDEVKDDDDDEDDDNCDDKSKGDKDRGMDSNDIPPTDTKIVSSLDVHVHHEVPRIHTSTLLDVSVSVIPEVSPVYMNIPQSSQTFTSLHLQSIPSPLPTTEATNITSLILDFASVFRFNDRVIALEKDVAELKNDPLHTQVTTNQLPQILSEEVSNFTPAVIEKMIQYRDDKDKDEGPSAGSDRGIKKRKTSKDAELTTSPKTKDLSSKSSKGTKSQPKSFGKSVHVEEPEFEVGDTNTPQGQEGYQGNDNDEPRTESASRCAWFTHVSVMRKHRYGYLEEIVVRRVDNALYKFKEGDFPRLRINDIEDMLLFVVQNRLTNLSGDDVADFAIALRMFTRSLVIQKRVEDLQLGVESYQKQINVTKPDTTRPDLKKRDSQNRRDLPRDILLDSVVVIRYDKRSKSENKGKVLTEMELVLELTQQERPSDTQVFTVKMEILFEPTSNKLLVGVNIFRNAIGAHYLPHSSEYVAPSSIDIVSPWFETIGYGEVVPTKETLKKSLFPPRWRLLMEQIIQCLGDIIIKLNKKHREKVIPWTRFLSSLMMHKMKEGYRDGNDALAVSTVEADLGNFAPSDFVPQQYGKGAILVARQIKVETSSTIKLEDLPKLVSHVQPSLKDLDWPEDDPVIVVDDSDEDEEDEVHATENVQTEDTSAPKSSSTSNLLPTDLKDLPSKFDELTEEIKGLKKQVHELEIELLGDLKEIPTKPKDFTKNVTSLTSQVADLKTLQ
nr:hypothetical protein [Tanacetum cinerariifolium]